MSLSFGHDDMEINHIHNIKPLVPLPYYQKMVKYYTFAYAGMAKDVWRYPGAIGAHCPRTNIITNGFEEGNTKLQLITHTFDADTRLLRIVIKYELRCMMKDGSVEFKDLNEFYIIPYKVADKIVDGMNIINFNDDRIYVISDIQPNFKNMVQMSMRFKQTNVENLGNESFLEVAIIHRKLMKAENDITLQTL